MSYDILSMRANESPRFFTNFFNCLIYLAKKSEISEVLKNLKNLEIF